MLELAVLEIAVYHPYISHFVIVVLLCFIHLPCGTKFIWCLLPNRRLPYTRLLEKAMYVLWNTSNKQEQISISKMVVGYVNESVLLTVYDVHNCVANPQCLVS